MQVYLCVYVFTFVFFLKQEELRERQPGVISGWNSGHGLPCWSLRQ